ncbi:MAG: hypothetical protein H0V18_19010 [Pyrinomonadaceae bacterium]|nr:hypothetical protein [Pyrinomonadaceae bacterium]
MKRKIFAIVTFVFLCFGSLVLAGQNTNSNTTMQENMNHNMSNGNMSGKRHRRHRAKKHRRHRHVKMDNKNSNM